MNSELIECVGGLLIAGALAATMIDVSDPVIVTIGGTVLATLTGAVKVLWDKNTKLSETTEIALSKCENEHKASAARMDALVQQVIALSAEVGTLKGRIQGYQEAKEQEEKS